MGSSSSADHAFTPRSYENDVFLNFRGEDVRTGFVDHFYTALVDRDIRTYKDDKSLRKTETIDLSLMKAIEESRMAVVIFSKNYADSSWCLDELVQIMKCREERGLKVVPVFYDVQVTDVRNQKNEFGEAFEKENAKNIAKADIWRQALVDVCKISGWELSKTANGHESQFIKEIIDTTISDGLSISNSHAADEYSLRARDAFVDVLSSLMRDLLVLLRAMISPVIEIPGTDDTDKTTLPTLGNLKFPMWYCDCDHCSLKSDTDETTKRPLHADKSKTNKRSGTKNERSGTKMKKENIPVCQKTQPVGIKEHTHPMFLYHLTFSLNIIHLITLLYSHQGRQNESSLPQCSTAGIS